MKTSSASQPTAKNNRPHLLGAAAAVVLILAPTLGYPYGRDQSVFAYIGSLVANGGLPYRDAWDLKPPGIYLLYGLIARLCPADGSSLMGWVRVADLLFAAATGLLLALLAVRSGRPEIGAPAAAWYAAMLLQPGWLNLAQAEAWANPLALGTAVLCLASAQGDTAGLSGRAVRPAHREVVGLLAAGALAGCAAVLKFTAVLPALPFLLFACQRGSGTPLLRALLLAVGAAVPLALVGLWLARGHAWSDFLDAQRSFLAPYSRLIDGTPARRVDRAFGYTLRWIGQNWLPFLLAGAALATARRPRLDPSDRVALAALAGGVIGVWLQNKYFHYHWQSALPAVAFLAGAGGKVLFSHIRVPRSALPAAGVALALASGVSGHWPDYRDSVRLGAGGLSQTAWLDRFQDGRGDQSFPTNRQVAEYVRDHTRSGDRILVWGFEPAVYLLSGRPASSRFFFNQPLVAPFGPVGWREEFMTELQARPPELFLVVRRDAIPWATLRKQDSAALLEEFPELRQWLADGYRPETRIDDFSLYRRSSRSAEHQASRAPGRLGVRHRPRRRSRPRPRNAGFLRRDAFISIMNLDSRALKR